MIYLSLSIDQGKKHDVPKQRKSTYLVHVMLLCRIWIYLCTRTSFRFEWGAPKRLVSPRAWACVARMWSRLFGLLDCVLLLPRYDRIGAIAGGRKVIRTLPFLSSFLNIQQHFHPSAKAIQPAPSSDFDTPYFSQEALLQPPISSFKASDPLQVNQDAFH